MKTAHANMDTGRIQETCSSLGDCVPRLAFVGGRKCCSKTRLGWFYTNPRSVLLIEAQRISPLIHTLRFRHHRQVERILADVVRPRFDSIHCPASLSDPAANGSSGVNLVLGK